MPELDNAVEELIATIRRTEEYQNYVREKEKVSRFPELKAQIDDFRARNYELQNMTDDQELFYKLEEFEREYEKFREGRLCRIFWRRS